jgi:hypothetical protein
VLLVSGAAAGNGRYPLANQLVSAPTDPSHLALRATYGLVLSSDRGATWTWVCEKAAGFVNGEDPPIELFEDGTVVIASSSGFDVSRDFGCAWSAALPDDQVVDADVDRSRPSRAIAITPVYADAKSYAALRESLDDGATWHALGTPFESFPLTVAIAPSDPARIYASGTIGQKPAISRSDDQGESWKTFPLPSPDDPVPFLAAVDPRDPNRVYVRATASGGDTLLVSSDGGMSWKEILRTSGGLFGFALSPDGDKVAVGGPADPLRVALTTEYAWKPVSTVRPSCLTWTAEGLYACADEALAGFALGLSVDDGAEFRTLFRLRDLTLKSCAMTTQAGKYCPSAWNALEPLTRAEGGAPSMDAGAESSVAADAAPGYAAPDESTPEGEVSAPGDAPGEIRGPAPDEASPSGSSGCSIASRQARTSIRRPGYAGTAGGIWIAVALAMGRRWTRRNSRPSPVSAP